MVSPQVQRRVLTRLLPDDFYQPADVPAVATEVLHFIHNAADQTDSKTAFPLLVDKLIQIRQAESVDVKCLAVVHDFKNDSICLIGIDDDFNQVFRVAGVTMNDQIGAHFIDGKNQFAGSFFVRLRFRQGILHEPS